MDNTALMTDAIRNGNVGEIKRLVKSGFDLEARGEHGWTPLITAVNKAGVDVIELLVTLGADIESRDEDGFSPLTNAVTNIDGSDVIELLVTLGADLEARDEDGCTPLITAAALNSSGDAIEMLVSLGADLEARNEAERTPLMEASASNASADVIERLVKLGADIEARDEDGCTPLMIAVAFNDSVDVIERLVELGANIEARDERGWTPLMEAASLNVRADVIERLVKLGADLEAKDGDGSTPLIIAAVCNDSVDVIKRLVELGADIEARNKDGWTPLMEAAANNKNADVIERLVTLGADLEARDEDGWTALTTAAAMNDSVDVIERLVKLGIDIESKDEDGSSPLINAAIACRNADVIEFLSKLEADSRQDEEYPDDESAAVSQQRPKEPRATMPPSVDKVALLCKELEDCRAAYGGSSNFHLSSEINNKQRINFTNNCKITDWSEVLALVDTTMLKSGKDGVAFCEDRIVWRNFAFEEPQSLSYTELHEAKLTMAGDELHIQTLEKEYIVSAISSDLKIELLKFVIIRVAECWQNNCSNIQLTEEEKLENEILSQLPKNNGNYFVHIRDNLFSKYNLRAFANVAVSMFNNATAVSQEETNDAYRKNPFQENANERKVVLLAYRFLSAAIDFPTVLNAEGKYSRGFIKALQSEYVTFEIFCLLCARYYKVTESNLDQEQARQLLERVLGKSLVPHIEWVSKQEVRQPERVRLKDVIGNGTVAENSIGYAALQNYRERLTWYSGVDRGSMVSDDIFRMLVLGRYENDAKGCSRSEHDMQQELQDLYGDRLSESLSNYIPTAEDFIEDALVEYFK